MKANINNIVVLNSSPDAVRWEVLGIDGTMLTVREVNTNYKPQLIDECQIYECMEAPEADALNS